ncbi:PDZ domain-containing protein [Larkinella knui]|uniref:M61 family peptidase n=1 Tax=Larkinella knui TaxID=2025310 RepID=A0A3P1CBX6_9BACT|nr:M61 family metallopeptidase [Larkinella knui]RRB10821.1 M61 family peptidase [Larkinella knui]
MHYRISSTNPSSRLLEIDFLLTDLSASTVELQLPAWRPGRYELQNFAKNIQRFEIFDNAGKPLAFQKLTKDRWRVQTEGVSALVARYTYYSNVINAGTSFADDRLLYINPVNLCLYADDRLREPCTLELAIPDDWQIACGMAQTAPNTLHASDFYELVDCPLIASPDLQHIQYEVDETRFHIWINGNIKPDVERLRHDFSRFSETQIRLFGEFPEKDYHFLTLILPTAFYHGVEHRNSTMLVLGPNDEGEGLYTDLLGVSSHELFHAWNVIRIRPTELLPYDFTRENYFTTCFVAEGVTTYYGDLILRRANVFNDAAYFKEFQVLLKRHFEPNGRAFQSLTEASWDLWLDGYDKGVPNRKVSVYHKGATVALMLDLHIRRKWNHTRSLDDVMRIMWERFGKPFIGYTLDDYRAVTEEVAGESLDWYYSRCIFGNEPLETLLNDYLAFIGLQLEYDTTDLVSTPSVLLVQLDDPAGFENRYRWLGEIRVTPSQR